MDEIDWAEASRVADWQYEVANGDTRLGFVQWCEHQKETALDG